jgi:hypothetical protein
MYVIECSWSVFCCSVCCPEEKGEISKGREGNRVEIPVGVSSK